MALATAGTNNLRLVIGKNPAGKVGAEPAGFPSGAAHHRRERQDRGSGAPVGISARLVALRARPIRLTTPLSLLHPH